MPVWLMRLLWRLRGKRAACLQLYGDAPAIKGLLCGCWGGHYVVLVPTALVAQDRTEALTGHVEVPKERVMFVQILKDLD